MDLEDDAEGLGTTNRWHEDLGFVKGVKTRVIDDCSVCGLNMTVGVREKFALHTIDQLCSMLVH